MAMRSGRRGRSQLATPRRPTLPTNHRHACAVTGSRSGRWPMTFLHLWTWQRCTTPREPKTSVMARRSPVAPSMTNSNVRSVGSPRVTRSLSRPVVTAAVSVAPSRRPSTCFRPCVSIPQRDHHAVVPEDLAVDADHPQVQLAQRPAEKRLEALFRQRHEPPQHGTARRRPLGHLGRYRVQRARVPARRHPGGDRGQCVLVQRVGGRRPLEARQRDFALGAPHPLPRQLDLPPAECHLAVDTPSAPRGPLDLMAPLRTTQDFPVSLHHRLQDLQPGRDAKAMERFPDTVDHAEDRQRHLDRDGARAGGWPDIFRLSCFAMGGSLLF